MRGRGYTEWISVVGQRARLAGHSGRGGEARLFTHQTQMILLGMWGLVCGIAVLALSRYDRAHPGFTSTYMRFRHPQTEEGERLASQVITIMGWVFCLGGLLLVVLAAVGWA